MTDEQRLVGVNATVARKVLAVLWEMRAIGHPMRVTEGYRSPARQMWLYAQGRTRPGPIVTSVRSSMHTQGRAVDCVFLAKGGGIAWDGPWAEYGRRAKRRGLRWGGDWTRLVDRPHVEL